MTDQPENLTALRKHYQENVIPILKLQKVLIEEECQLQNPQTGRTDYCQ